MLSQLRREREKKRQRIRAPPAAVDFEWFLNRRGKKAIAKRIVHDLIFVLLVLHRECAELKLSEEDEDDSGSSSEDESNETTNVQPNDESINGIEKQKYPFSFSQLLVLFL